MSAETKHMHEAHAHVHGAHAHTHEHGHSNAPRRALTIALFLTAGFMIVELGVGLWSGSLALLADAGHMLGDAGALGLSLVIAHIAARPRSPQKTYGYRRAEVLGAFANAVTLIVVAVLIVTEAAQRFTSPPTIRASGMLITATLGLMVNLLAAGVLARGARENINVRSALLHVLGDALGSVVVIIAALLLLFFGWRHADPIASLCVVGLLLVGAVRLLLETTHVLMEGTPEGLDVASLERTIADTAGVKTVHDLHVWSLTPGEPMLTAHVVLDGAMHGTDVARLVGQRLHDIHGIEHVTIQPEAPQDVLVALRRK